MGDNMREKRENFRAKRENKFYEELLKIIEEETEAGHTTGDDWTIAKDRLIGCLEKNCMN